MRLLVPPMVATIKTVGWLEDFAFLPDRRSFKARQLTLVVFERSNVQLYDNCHVRIRKPTVDYQQIINL